MNHPSCVSRSSRRALFADQFITTVIFDIVYCNLIGKHATSVIKIVIVTYGLIL